MTDLSTVTIDEADKALKAKHRAMWASGDYPRLAHDLIWSLGPVSWRPSTCAAVSG